MTTTDIKAALRAWAKAHSSQITAAVGLLVLGALMATCAHAHDKAPKPAPEPVVAENTCRDKYKCDHFVASAFLGVAVGRGIDTGNRWRWADDRGCGVSCQRWAACLAPGIAKELHDQHRWGTGNWKDMAANALGCALGLYVSREF